MRIGVFTPLLSHLSIDDVMKKLKSLGVTTFELGTGNYPGDPHIKLSLLESKTALKEFKQKLDDNGFTISALSSHGNPLHPNPAVAKKYQDTSRKTVLLDDPHSLAGGLLASATTRIVYDVERFQSSRAAAPTDATQWQPAFAASRRKSSLGPTLPAATSTEIPAQLPEWHAVPHRRSPPSLSFRR